MSLETPGWTHDVYLAAEVADLVVIAEIPGQVILGPASGEDLVPGSKGIAMQAGVTGLTVEGFTVEHTRQGAYISGSATLRNCVFRNNTQGVIAYADRGMLIAGTHFANNDDGLLAFAPSAHVVVEGSTFVGGAGGILLTQVDGARVIDCTFRQMTLGIQFDRTSNGEVEDVRMSGCTNASLAVITNSQVTATNCRFGSSFWTLVVSGTGTLLQGSGNTIEAGGDLTIRFLTNGQAAMNGNDIVLNGGRSIDFSGSTLVTTMDLSRNYWGTTDGADISAGIWDAVDDPGVNTTIQFEPFLDKSVPVANRSMGSLKQRY